MGNLIAPAAVNISKQLVDFVVIKDTAQNLKHNLKKIQPSRYFKKTISDVLADKCYPDEIKIELKTFISHENQILFEEIKPIYEKFCKSSNAEMLSNSSCHFIQIL